MITLASTSFFVAAFSATAAVPSSATTSATTENTAASSTATRSLKKRPLGLIVLLAIVAVLSCIYIALLTSTEEDTTSETDPILLDIAASDIVALSFDGSEGSFSLELTNDTWMLVDNNNEVIDQDVVSSVITTIITTTYSRAISENQISEDMGLSSPSLSVTVGTVDGTSYILSFGIETPNGSSFYTQLSSSAGAYLVEDDVVAALTLAVGDFYAQESGPGALSTYFTAFVVDRGSETLSLTYSKDSDDSSGVWIAEDNFSSIEAESTQVIALINIVNNVVWESCITTADNGTNDYGFDSPTLRITFSYTTETEYETGDLDEDGNIVYATRTEECVYVLLVGNTTADGTYYARPEGSQAVYTLDADDVATLLATSAADLATDDESGDEDS